MGVGKATQLDCNAIWYVDIWALARESFASVRAWQPGQLVV